MPVQTKQVGPEVLAKPEFWLRYFYQSLRALPEEPVADLPTRAFDPWDVLLRTLGITETQVKTLDGFLHGTVEDDPFEGIGDDDTPPFFSVLRLSLGPAYIWQVGFFGGDDPGIYHDLLTANLQGVPLGGQSESTLARMDIHSQLPALRFAEVQPLSAVAAQHSPGLTEGLAFLLFAPLAYLTNQEDIKVQQAAYASALKQADLGLTAEAIQELSVRLSGAVERGFSVEDLYDESKERCGDAPFRWWNPEGQGWRCNSWTGYRREGSSWSKHNGYKRFDDVLSALGVLG